MQEPELEEQLPRGPARLWMVSTLESTPRPRRGSARYTAGRIRASGPQGAEGQRQAEVPERRHRLLETWVDLGVKRAEEGC